MQTTAAHNFAGWDGHAVVGVPMGAQTALPITFYGFMYQGQLYGTYTATLTIRWRASTFSAAVVSPAGVRYPLDAPGSGDASLYLWCEESLSPRGTSMLGAYFIPMSGAEYTGFEDEVWSLELENRGAEDATADVWVIDDTGYPVFVSFETAGTDVGTIAPPSTADSAISVGASVGNYSDGQPPLALRYYSGRGPRIDGELSIDVVAPSDHATAASGSAVAPGDHRFFDGTSGALPMVAGAAALLLQAEPAISPAEVQQRIQAGAVSDGITGATPNPEWGAGRLSAYRTIAGTDPVSHLAPVAALSFPAQVAPGESATADASGTADADDDAGTLLYRYDFDYDGVADAEGIGLTQASFIAERAGTAWVKLEVEDPSGLRGEAIARVTISSPPRPRSAEEGCGCVSGGGALWLASIAVLALRLRRT